MVLKLWKMAGRFSAAMGKVWRQRRSFMRLVQSTVIWKWKGRRLLREKVFPTVLPVMVHF